MRKLLFSKACFARHLPRQAPAPGRCRGERTRKRRRQCGAAAARPKSSRYARSTLDPAMDASLRFTRLNNAYYDVETLRHPVRGLAAPRRCLDGDRPRDQKTCAKRWSAPIMRSPNPKWVVCDRRLRPGRRMFRRQLRPSLAVSPKSSPVDLHIPGCPPYSDRDGCKVCWRCSKRVDAGAVAPRKSFAISMSALALAPMP